MPSDRYGHDGDGVHDHEYVTIRQIKWCDDILDTLKQLVGNDGAPPLVGLEQDSIWMQWLYKRWYECTLPDVDDDGQPLSADMDDSADGDNDDDHDHYDDDNDRDNEGGGDDDDTISRRMIG